MIHDELYNVRDLPRTKGSEKLQKEHCSNLICTCTHFQLIYTNVNLLGLEICSYLCLLFYSNYLLNSYQPLSNSLEPSSSTHSLQIYCLGLIGSTYPIFWVWVANRDLTIYIYQIIHNKYLPYSSFSLFFSSSTYNLVDMYLFTLIFFSLN